MNEKIRQAVSRIETCTARIVRAEVMARDAEIDLAKARQDLFDAIADETGN